MSRFLLEAAARGDIEKVRKLLDQGADIAWSKRANGRTALTEAAIIGNLETVRLLLERGADVNWRDTAVGYTPLAWACELNHVELAKYLIAAGADVNLASPEIRWTPLLIAAAKGRLSLVEALVAAGADIVASKCDGQTALALAQSNRRSDVAEFLAMSGASAENRLPVPSRIPWPASGTHTEKTFVSGPEAVLRGFILAMHDYELAAARATSNAEIHVLMQVVFDRFCTQKPRPYGRYGSFQSPPEYDPDGEYLVSIELVNSRRAELSTRDDRWNQENLYVVLKQRKHWRLDSKKRRLIGGQWSAAIL